jgi:gas vesicle protein
MQKKMDKYLCIGSGGRRRMGLEEGGNKGERKGGGVMTENGNNQSNFLIGFLFGSILGALVGVFFAPKSGKELRSKIKEKGTEVLKDAEEIYEEATAVLDDLQRHAEELKRDLLKVCQKAKEVLAWREKKET